MGVFGFDVYDFAEDLNVQALGAIFEQSLKDTIKGPARVRGFGRFDHNENAGGVFYTPGEITSDLVRRALDEAFDEIERTSVPTQSVIWLPPGRGWVALSARLAPRL